MEDETNSGEGKLVSGIADAAGNVHLEALERLAKWGHWDTLRDFAKGAHEHMRDVAYEILFDQFPTEMALLAEALSDSSPEVRFAAANRLVDVPCAPDLIRMALGDTDELVRIAALEAVEYHNCTDFETQVVELLDDEDPLVRGYAATALGVMAPSCRDLMVARYHCETAPSSMVRLAGALVSLGCEEYLTVVIGFLTDSDYRIRSTAARLLDFETIRTLSFVSIKRAERGLRRALRQETSAASREAIVESLKTYCTKPE